MYKMLVCWLLAITSTLLSAVSQTPEPNLKIINFTADWCPNCQILNPRMDEAISSFEQGEIQRVDLDMTKAKRGTSVIEVAAVHTEAMKLAASHKAAYLWDWYGGVTGIAVIIAADNGEPISCLMRNMTSKQMKDRMRLAMILAKEGVPGQRKPQGPDCIPPLN